MFKYKRVLLSTILSGCLFLGPACAERGSENVETVINNIQETEEEITKEESVEKITEGENAVMVQKKLVREMPYDADGGLLDWKEYEYNEQGYKIKCTQYYAEGIVYSVDTYEYDEKWNLVNETQDVGRYIVCIRYEYDDYGRKIKRISWLPNSEDSTQRCEYEYDEKGNLIKYVDYDDEGEVCYSKEYMYDNDGNCVEEIAYYGDGSIQPYGNWHKYEYNETGNRIKDSWYEPDGSLSGWKDIEYDNYGKETQVIMYTQDGSVGYWNRYENEYDEFGNLTKCTEYDADGNLERWTEYIYE